MAAMRGQICLTMLQHNPTKEGKKNGKEKGGGGGGGGGWRRRRESDILYDHPRQ